MGAKWLLLTEFQIDRIVRYRHALLLGGLAIMALPFSLPRGWGFGIVSGFMLFSLGIYGLWFQKWRTNPGLWMLAVLLIVTLGPCWVFFEYEYWKRVFAPVAANQARALTWDQIRFSADTVVALLLFTKTIRLAGTVAIENWMRTRKGAKLGEICPECGGAVTRPNGCGSWTGARPNGIRAAGGYFKTTCPSCGIRLDAYFNVYDDYGNIPYRPADWNPEVVWQKDTD